MECSKFHWPVVAGLKDQSSRRLVRNIAHAIKALPLDIFFLTFLTLNFNFNFFKVSFINAIWHPESKKTLGTRLLLMPSLSKFVKFFNNIVMLPRPLALVLADSREIRQLLERLGHYPPFQASFALTLNFRLALDNID